MKVSLITYGSRGDVEPFVALGQGFRQAGHAVRLAAPEALGQLIQSTDLEHVPLPGDPDRLVADLVQRAGRNPWRMVTVMSRHVLPLAARVFDRVWQACHDRDLIVHSFLLTNAGYEIAKQLNVPDISAQLFPIFSPTSAFPAGAFPNLPFGSTYRRFSHWITVQTFWQGSRILYRQLRKAQPHLPPLSGWPFSAKEEPRTPILYGYSPHVVPRPDDWKDDVHITGYWFRESGGQWYPDDQLLAFLEAGSRPIYIGFGSTIARKAEHLAHEAIRALELTEQRGVLSPGWGGLNPRDCPENVFLVESVPHGWLFPRMAAIVHHGGAGTTGAGLRAGVPNIVVPFTSDQPFWGRRVFQLGAGPRPISPSKFTAEKLAHAIHEALNNAGMRSSARTLGEQIRSEDGVARAVEFAEKLADTHFD